MDTQEITETIATKVRDAQETKENIGTVIRELRDPKMPENLVEEKIRNILDYIELTQTMEITLEEMQRWLKSEVVHLATKLAKYEDDDVLKTIAQVHEYSQRKNRGWKRDNQTALRTQLTRMVQAGNLRQHGGGRGRGHVAQFYLKDVEAAFKMNIPHKNGVK